MKQGENQNDCPAARLLDGEPVSLTGWYGGRLSHPTATVLLSRTLDALQQHLRSGSRCFQLHLLELICHGRLGSRADPGYARLVALAGDTHEAALLELVQGQLLASRKQTGAMEYLQRGFRLAAPLLGAREYFELLHRHELLGSLPYSEQPAAVHELASLRNEAAVICRLESNLRKSRTCSHQDTLG